MMLFYVGIVGCVYMDAVSFVTASLSMRLCLRLHGTDQARHGNRVDLKPRSCKCSLSMLLAT